MQIWKDEWAATLVARREAGDTFAQIAVYLSATYGTTYTESACNRKIRSLLGPVGSVTVWSEELTARLVELYNSQPAIAFSAIAKILNAEFGISLTRSAVIGRANRLKLKGNAYRTPPGGGRARERVGRNPPVLRIKSIAPDPIPKLRCVEVEPLHITLLDLEPPHCRYPYGGDNGVPVTFCGNPRLPSYSGKTRYASSYCGPHFAICCRPETARVAA